MNGPPPRLRDDPTTRDALRDDLERAERSPVQAYDRERGLGRLRAAIAVGAVGDGGSGSAASGGGAAGGGATGSSVAVAKWVGLALIGGAVIGGGVAMRPRDPAPPSAVAAPAPVVAPTPTAPVAAPTPTPAPVAPTEAPVAPVTAEPEPAAAPAQVAPHRKTHTVRAIDPDDALRRETAQLAEARRLSLRDPRAALALAERGHREFPQGMFHEEREAIAIFALDELGRTRVARRRATAFLARHPNGPFSERMRDTVLAPSP